MAYGGLLQERRRALHARIVEVLEALAGDRVTEVAPGRSLDQVEWLAYHALRGEVWAKALAYCRQAGEKAMARSAYREAGEYFEQALSVLTHLPETRDTREQAIDLRLALRSALTPSGDWRRILASLREAEALAEALNDLRRLAQVALFLSHHYRISGMYDQAITAALRALTPATAGGEVILHALAHFRLGQAYRDQGDYRRAIVCFRQTIAPLDEGQSRERFGRVFLPAVSSCADLAWCHAELGMFAEGHALGAQGLRIAEAVNHPASLMSAYGGIGLLALRQGDLSRALPLLTQAVSLCRDMDLLTNFPRMAATLGAAYTLAGRLADAVPLLTQVMEQAIAMELVYIQALCGFSLGEAQMLASRLEEACALAEQALAHARAHQERGHQAYALHLLGEIAAHRNLLDVDEAASHYRQALTLAEELGMLPLQAHCHRNLGTLYAKTRQQEQARAELSTAIEMYRAMDMTFWLPQAQAVLAQVER